MLTLARFKNESIIITTTDGRVEVVIRKVHHNGKVQLGIEAPKSIAVHRKEIQVAIDREKEKEKTNGTIAHLPGQTH